MFAKPPGLECVMVHVKVYEDIMSQSQAEIECAIEDEKKSQESACKRIRDVLAGRVVKVIAEEVDAIQDP